MEHLTNIQLENSLNYKVNQGVISKNEYNAMLSCVDKSRYVDFYIKKQIDVNEENILQYNKKLFDTLLKDRTTGRNIIWATSDYEEYGDAYGSNCEILSTLITGSRNKIIRPRAAKSRDNQLNRTREKAEVFTPSWICNAQNNLVDEQWFGRADVFNYTKDKQWKATKEKIVFPNDKKHTWQKYVDGNRMEITCGEAPYLVSRYDTVTGKYIEIEERIGLLDRKLRVVNENTEDIKDWYKWTVRAFQSIYGFEYQGDNLLLARENLLFTFMDNMKFKFNILPNTKQLQEIATIISWNIWQMDGLTYVVPMCDMAQKKEQLSFFDKSNTPQYCKIKDWRSKEIITFKSLLEKA